MGAEKQVAVGRGACFAAALALAALWSAPAVAGKRIEARLGLDWGMSLQDVLDIDPAITLEDLCLDEDDGRALLVHGLRQWLPDIEGIILYFGFDDRLWRIAISSKGIRDDGSGTTLLARYDEVRELLVEDYGEGVANHHRDQGAVADTSWYLGSLQVGTSWHYSQFDTDEVSVQLGLRAGNMSSGRYLVYVKSLVMEAGVDAAALALRNGLEQAIEPPLPVDCKE